MPSFLYLPTKQRFLSYNDLMMIINCEYNADRAQLSVSPDQTIWTFYSCKPGWKITADQAADFIANPSLNSIAADVVCCNTGQNYIFGNNISPAKINSVSRWHRLFFVEVE